MWVLAFAVLTLGCGASTSNDDQAQEPAAASPTPSREPSPTAGPTGLATRAVADLATRLDVEVSSIEVVSDEAVTWSDGSLGCAKPGMVYTQALVEGARIVLRLEEKDYEYHSSGDSQPFWCEKPTA